MPDYKQTIGPIFVGPAWPGNNIYPGILLALAANPHIFYVPEYSRAVRSWDASLIMVEDDVRYVRCLGL